MVNEDFIKGELSMIDLVLGLLSNEKITKEYVISILREQKELYERKKAARP